MRRNAPINIRRKQPVAIVGDLDPSEVDICSIYTVNRDIPAVNSVDIIPDNSKNEEYIQIARDMNIDVTDDSLTQDQKLKFLALIGYNRDVFAMDISELGNTPLQKYEIDTQGATPIHQRFYRTSPKIKEEIQRQCDEMLKHGIIEQAPSSAWQAPVVMVKKKSGEYRFAIDYRRLNSVTSPKSFPLPRLEDVFDALGQAKARLYSTLNMSSGFWQIPMAQESKDKTGFVTHHGVFRFNKMPYGLMNSPSTFALVMSKALTDSTWKYSLTYVDDIIIFSSDFKQHIYTQFLINFVQPIYALSLQSVALLQRVSNIWDILSQKRV